MLQAVAVVNLVASESQVRFLALGLLATHFVGAVAWQAVIFAPGRLNFGAWWLFGVLVLVIAATAAAWRASTIAALLIAPTIVWMSVATTLGFSIARLNPGA